MFLLLSLNEKIYSFRFRVHPFLNVWFIGLMSSKEEIYRYWGKWWSAGGRIGRSLG